MKFGLFLRILLSEIVKNAFFTQNHKFSQKNKNLSLEEHVLKELSISIDMVMFFSSFEDIVLNLGGKVMTFVFYPLLRSQRIVKKTGIRQNNLRLKVLFCNQCQIN